MRRLFLLTLIMCASCCAVNAERVTCRFLADDAGMPVGKPQVRVFDSTGKMCGYTDLNYTDGTFQIEEGTYSVLYEFPGTTYDFLSAIIVKTGVVIDEGTELVAVASEACYEVEFDAQIAEGEQMEPPLLTDDYLSIKEKGNVDYQRFDMFIYPQIKTPNLVFFKAMICLDRRTRPIIRFSNVPAELCISFGLFAPSDNDFYIAKHVLANGIDKSMLLHTYAEDYLSASIVSDYVQEPSQAICAGCQLLYVNEGQELSTCLLYRQDVAADIPVNIFMSGQNNDNAFEIQLKAQAAFSADYTIMGNTLYINSNVLSPAVERHGDELWYMANDMVRILSQEEQFTLPNGPIFCTGLPISPDYISIGMEPFSGLYGQYALAPFDYSIMFNGEQTSSGNGRSEFMYALYGMYPPFAAGERRIIFTSHGPDGMSDEYTANCEMIFDFEHTDCAPPEMRVLTITDDRGISRTVFDKEDNINLLLQAGDWKYGLDNTVYTITSDYLATPEVKVEIAPCGSDEWSTLNVEAVRDALSQGSGQLFLGEIPPGNLNTGAYDLKVTLSDEAGNYTIHTLHRVLNVTESVSIEKGVESLSEIGIHDGRIAVNVVGKVAVNIYDLSGQAVYSNSSTGVSPTYFDIPVLPQGCYLLKVNSDGNKENVFKLII